MGATGSNLDDVKANADNPEFLGAVLDFVLMDDAWVIACSDACGFDYTKILQLRAALPGGPAPHWT